MKYLHIIFFLLSLGHSFAQDAVDQLSKKYTEQAQEGLIRLHTRHREELTKIQNAAMELKDLALANKANAKIKEIDDEIRKLGGTPTEPKPVQEDTEFDNTSWAFHNKAGRLGELVLLAGGKIKSDQYPKSGWHRIDKDTIRFQYDRDDKSPDAGHVIFRFQGAARDQMSGIQSGLRTPRYLYKLTK